ncbi:hypothetical protein RCS94_01810 [Orbaceae bacterium ac157xtp]
MIVPSSYGALSATSANTIKGNAPTFKGNSDNDRVGFVVEGEKYSQALGNIDSSVIKNFNVGLTLSDFKIASFTADDYDDVDGDAPHPTTPFAISSSAIEWRDSNNTLIPSSRYNQFLGCGSSFNFPLTLKIKLSNVKVRSLYGNPKESTPTDLVKTYKIGVTSGICFAKPNSLNWYSSWGTSGNSTNGGGYSSDFDPSNGFKVSASTKFPTTGFPGAEFTLIMTNNARDYTFSSNDSAVVVDTTGKVTLNSKPSGAVTIKAIYKNDTSQVHYYTFNPTTVWVRPTGTNSHGTYAWAKTQCGGAFRIPSLAQLTNSPMKTGYEGVSSIPANAYTRAVGGGVFGEWGWTSNTTYPGSQWRSSSNYCWTRDVRSTSYQFLVDSDYGYVHYFDTRDSGYVACLE